MAGTIYLDITTGVGRSTIELNLNRDDIRRLYEKEFASDCIICHGPLGDSSGYVCCKCFSKESRHHADCCLAEEEEK